ncbi:YCII-related protein [Fibrella aestuarina BUZ 2]|uniref:YCII-related protein n=1 Tax=Fibrella aestuarina BUZ 2 TaxID=1166018 RepID=I0KEW2_9BACT|nr:YciI family protein [Fibrella aestuarina]CCH02665.1 YCII-related protein [Fibrella aestuarina BUZ 2]
MNEFMLLFRQPSYDTSQLSPAEFEAIANKWKEWVGSLAAQGKLVSTGPRLASEGKVLKAGGIVTDGPFVEVKERLGSFLIVRASHLDEATELAHGCPALDAQGSVEIRAMLN